MKKHYGVLVVFTLLFLGSCQRITLSPSESTTADVTMETAVTALPVETTDIVLESWTSYPLDWPEPPPVIKKNRDAILEVLPGSAYSIYNIAYYRAQGLAEDFNEIGISEFKEIKILKSDEEYYVVQFVDMNGDVYSVDIKKTDGSYYYIWKEGEEEPVFSRAIV